MANCSDGKRHEKLRIDVAVIGAGVVGLAIARLLAIRGQEVYLFEKEAAIGTHTSSRNSEVIHSGIHYPNATPLKARLCVDGKENLYQYCAVCGIRRERIGKLLVATTDDEIPRLDRLHQQGLDNGVHDLSWLSPNEIHDLEPFVSGVKALFSPSTGIVDSHALMAQLRRDALDHQAVVMTSTPVLSGRVEDNGIALTVGDADRTTVLCQKVVNSAGLYASEVARSIDGVPRASIPSTYYAKGHYYTITERPFDHLVYPMPVAGGLGIHVTLDIQGNVRFGPDLRWVDGIDYVFDHGHEEAFYSAIRHYFPRLKNGSLQPGYTGIRPKIARPGEQDRDFVISGTADHGIDGLVNLFGIESPGLTASLAIAEYVASLLER